MKIAPVSADLLIKLALVAAAAGVVYYGFRKLSGVAGSVADAAEDVIDGSIGLVTGNNVITQSATNSTGDRVTAYEGVPVLGTLGAATNALSFGYLADFGGWIGRKTYDLTH
jgi:hypothetical protein